MISIENFHVLSKYFNENFIGDTNLNTRCCITHWSSFHPNLHLLRRTTNNIEGWHRAFNKIFKIKHLNIGLFIDVLKIKDDKIVYKLARFKNCIFDSKEKILKKMCIF